MCYHVKIHHPAHQIAQTILAEEVEGPPFIPQTQISGFQHPHLPIWHLHREKAALRTMSWGLWPKWSTYKDLRPQTLNARIETVEEKPSFKDAWTNRGILPVTGFYEWQWLDTKGKKKQPFLLEKKDATLFYLAAIWQPEHSFYPHLGFSLLTLPAEGCMVSIHNHGLRMPYVLDFDGAKEWLNGKKPEPMPFLLQPKILGSVLPPTLPFPE